MLSDLAFVPSTHHHPQPPHVEDKVAAARQSLLKHPLFASMQTFAQMRYFMECHVFAVWDFMSLLKTLQARLTTLRTPWTPPAHKKAARLINEIVIAEESDLLPNGCCISHFELYLNAMREAGASTVMIDALISTLGRGGSFEHGLSAAGAPLPVRGFVRSTMAFTGLATHEVAAAFLYGREDLVPEMFARLLANTPPTHAADFRTLKLYLERHIEVDGGSHGPMAKELMHVLCGDDADKWQAAQRVAVAAIQARHQLWDGVLAGLPKRLNA